MKSKRPLRAEWTGDGRMCDWRLGERGVERDEETRVVGNSSLYIGGGCGGGGGNSVGGGVGISEDEVLLYTSTHSFKKRASLVGISFWFFALSEFAVKEHLFFWREVPFISRNQATVRYGTELSISRKAIVVASLSSLSSSWSFQFCYMYNYIIIIISFIWFYYSFISQLVLKTQSTTKNYIRAEGDFQKEIDNRKDQ